MMKILLVLYVFLLLGAVFPEPVEDRQALLDFMENIHFSRPINWSTDSDVCTNWTGITCNVDHTRVVALRLPGMGFRGTIPPHTLSRLSAIQIISLRSNKINGSFPSSFVNLKNLTTLYLQFNKFSGPLPSDFSPWKELSIVNFSNNEFNESIPLSISKLSHLTALNLANNSLSGDIPDLNIPSLQQLDLSNNNLSGQVPKSLSRFPSSAFAGNNLLAESSLTPPFPIPQTKKNKKTKLSEPALLGIVIGGCALGFVMIAVLMVICYSRKKRLPVKAQKKTEMSLKKRGLSDIKEKNNSLTFFEGCSLAFDLEDLLRASAEVLGKGMFGTTYRAALEDATTVVVKRLKEVTVAKREFEQHMEVVGSIRHENVSPLRAYYYSKDEKLMVYDYYNQGSVSAMLHGKRGEGRNALDWETRLRIAIGTARAIAYIHTQNGGKLVHGNIKASNIFLNSEGYGCVSDIGLVTLMSPMPPPVMRAAGYRAPEITDSRKTMQVSDVYSFGVLLLELLTGKSPTHPTSREEVVHLVRWVNSVVREEWTAEVFDIELLKYTNIEEEMVEMLQIGLSCVVRMPEERPKMADVVKMVENIRPANPNLPSPESHSEVLMSTPTPEKATEVASTSKASQ